MQPTGERLARHGLRVDVRANHRIEVGSVEDLGQLLQCTLDEDVRDLLPRPAEEPDEPEPGRMGALAARPARLARRAATETRRLITDFAAELRGNLSDPITPILATGAAASALLGSPFDAALVGGVLLANAALSAQQQLHAERMLRRLLAVQDPSARRVVGDLSDRQHREVDRHERVGSLVCIDADYHHGPPLIIGSGPGG